MKFMQSLFAHYKAYHQHGPLMLTYAGILGAVCFPAFYFLRFAKGAPVYDDMAVRGIAALLCLLLLLKNHWPRRLQPYYLAYSYPAMVFSLPVHFVFTSLMNGGGPVAVGNTLMAAFFVILVTDWRNTLVMLVLGFAIAIGLYAWIDPTPTIPADYLARLPLLVLVVAGGSLFKAAGNRAAAEKMRHAYASIAGTIAHEMRNPLAQLKNSLGGIQRALPLPGSASGHSVTHAELDALYGHLAQGELAVARGLQVISMTLDEVSEKPIDTRGFCYLSAAHTTHKAVREFAFDSEADRAKVSVQVEQDFTFKGDETAYLFVLFNLIQNALYYLASQPQARVTLVVDGQVVKVHDTGPGIAPGEMARLFKPFRTSGKAGGTGLGLAYCQRVMRAFGGDIGCESQLGAYTRFTLRFPPVTEEETQAYRAALLGRARAVFAGRRLLVVDDDSAQRLTTRHKLMALDTVVDQAADGRRALDMLAANRYDLVLLDLNMPVLDGYGVAEAVRAGMTPASSGARIVAHTSEPAHLASVKTQKAGMDGFATKPCETTALMQVLLEAMTRPARRLDGEQPLAGMRILVADDSAANRKAVAAHLKHAGATVAEAAHGQAVLDHLQEPGAWHAVLMDMHMPGIDGLAATRAIRAGSAWPELPIIAVTAHSDEAAQAAGRAAGMNDFIIKPIDAQLLIEKLQRLSGAKAALAGAGDASAAAPADDALLDLERLQSHARIGMLEELLNDFVPEIARLAGKLESAVAAQDLQGALDALHSLLGMSGEAGARALYVQVRQTYVAMLESRRWPASGDWLGRIKLLASRTERALRAYGALHATAGAD